MKEIKIEILIEMSIKTNEMIEKAVNKDIEIHTKTCSSFKILCHFSFIMYQLPIRTKNFKTRNNKINDDAVIIKQFISNPNRTNSKLTIVGIKMIKPERRILLAINDFLTILSLKYRFL